MASIIREYEAYRFGPRSHGFYGDCSYSSCGRAPATHMRVTKTKKGHRYTALCDKHTPKKEGLGDGRSNECS